MSAMTDTEMRPSLLSALTVDRGFFMREASRVPICCRADRMSVGGGRSTHPTGIVMSMHAKHQIAPASSEGIYPFKKLPVQLGFPARTDFKIVYNSKGSATAVMALREFPRLSRICRVSGHLLPYRCGHTRQLAAGIHVYDPLFLGLIKHCCEPSVFFDTDEMRIWALLDIKKGDRLTMDFATTEDKLLRQFACSCRCSKCRGWILGYDESPNTSGEKFFKHWHRRNSG